MANLCIVTYAVEGEKSTLLRIKEAFEKPSVIDEGSCETWLGNVLLSLGIDAAKFEGRDLSGFTSYSNFDDEAQALILVTEDKWSRCKFGKILEENISGIKVYYQADCDDDGEYTTNDEEGKYFPERYIVDGDLEMEYFKTKQEMLDYIKENYGVTDESEFDNDEFHTHEYEIESL